MRMVTEITDAVYDITCFDEPEGKRYRAFLFTDGTPTLFDAGLSGTTDALADGISAVGSEPERLVITHGDGDHVGGFDSVVDRYDVETWVPEQFDVETEHEPDNWYGDGDRIGRFTAIHTPGHAPENHSLIDEDAGIVVLGDALSGADQRGLQRVSSTSHQRCTRRTSIEQKKASKPCSSTSSTLGLSITARPLPRTHRRKSTGT